MKTDPLEFKNRCPACKIVSPADEWEVGGADPGFQFCPVCSREVMPVNLYLEKLGCIQEGLINHDGPAKAQAELDATIEEIRAARAAAPPREKNRTGDPYGLTLFHD